MDGLFASSKNSLSTSSFLQSIEDSRWTASSLTLPGNIATLDVNDERNKCLLKMLAVASASCIRTLQNIKNNFPNFETCDGLYWQSFVLRNEVKALKKLIKYYGGNFWSLAASEDNEAAFSSKFEWVVKCSSNANTASISLVVQATVEGILSLRFMLVLCGLEKDYPELTECLDLMIQDKVLLRQLICSMFRDVESDAKPKEAQVWHLVKEAVDLEKEFFDSVIQPLFSHCSTSPTIRGYIDNEGESLLEELGLTGTWKLRKPIQLPEVDPDSLDVQLECETVPTGQGHELLESDRDVVANGATLELTLRKETHRLKNGKRKQGVFGVTSNLKSINKANAVSNRKRKQRDSNNQTAGLDQSVKQQSKTTKKSTSIF